MKTISIFFTFAHDLTNEYFFFGMNEIPVTKEPTIEQTAVLLIDIASALMSSGAHTMRIKCFELGHIR